MHPMVCGEQKVYGFLSSGNAAAERHKAVYFESRTAGRLDFGQPGADRRSNHKTTSCSIGRQERSRNLGALMPTATRQASMSWNWAIGRPRLREGVMCHAGMSMSGWTIMMDGHQSERRVDSTLAADVLHGMA